VKQGDSIDRVSTCDLQLIPEQWDFAARNAGAIDAHWLKRQQDNPGFFNGTIHIARTAWIATGRLTATMLATDFKSFLYWREQGYPPASTRDAFGSTILRGCDGAVLLGRQTPGNINDGQAYLPGGFIDARDVAANGTVDIAASIARELQEETRLDLATLEIRPGFLVVQCGALLSIAQEFVSVQPAAELRATILAQIADDPEPELADLVIIRNMGDLKHHRVPPYTAMALATVFEQT